MSLLVVGASTSAAPAGSTLPPAEKIKLAQESMAKWQKLVQDQMSECQKLLAVSNLLLEYFISHRSSSWLLSLDFYSGHGGTRELQASRELGSSRLERAVSRLAADKEALEEMLRLSLQCIKTATRNKEVTYLAFAK